MTIRALPYIRVSTNEQAEGYSPDGQLTEMLAYIAVQGWQTVGPPVEDIGEKRWTLNRPGIDRIRELAADGEIDVVLAWRWDRFGESPWPEVLALELEEYGVRLIALDATEEGEDQELMRVLKGQFAKKDQTRRVERSMMGKMAKARSGHILGAGFRPRYGFGYVRNEKGKAVGYEVDSLKMATVRRILEMVAGGSSLHAVQDALEKDRVEAPGGGSRWSRATLRYMTLDDVYRPHSFDEVAPLVAGEVAGRLDPETEYGISWWGKRKTSRKSHRSKSRVAVMKDPSEWIAIPVDLSGSGLDRDLVDAARSAVLENRRTPTMGARFNELAGGVFFCGGCGNRMVPDSRRRNPDSPPYYYYRCETKHSRGVDACPLPRSYRAEQVEAEVFGYVRRLFSEPRSLVDALDILIEEERALSGDPEDRMKAILRRLADLDRQKANAQSSAVRDLLADGTLDPAMIRAQLAEFEEQRRDLERELEACDTRGQRVRDLERLKDACIRRAEMWEGLLEQMPDMLDHVVGDPPWASDAFARGLGSPLENASPQEWHQNYRQLGIKVYAMPEGGIQIDGEIVQGYMKQVGCVRVEPTS